MKKIILMLRIGITITIGGPLSYIYNSIGYLLGMMSMIILHMIAHGVGSFYGEKKSQVILLKGLTVWCIVAATILVIIQTIGIAGIAFILMPKGFLAILLGLMLLVGRLIGKRRKQRTINRILYGYNHPRMTPVKAFSKKIEHAALFLK